MPNRPEYAVRIHQTGGFDQLRVEPIDVPDPSPGEVRLRQTAIGLNYIDTYHRSGLYPVGPLPAVLGSEAAGVVVSVGAGVTGIHAGDRVAYCTARGAYASARVIEADRLVKLPDAISDETAAAGLLKGLTAEYLLRRTCQVKDGDTVLVHAAAGGVGSILCQWARALGARVIGAAGSPEKLALARSLGCTETIDTSTEDIAARVHELTGGRGVDVVFDGVGRQTFDASLASVRRRGLLVCFGNASGPVPPFDILRLSAGGQFLARPSLAAYVATREELTAAAAVLFDVISQRTVRIDVNQRFALRDVKAAHQALEARQTTGSTVLLP